MDSLDGWVSRELCGGTHMDHTSQAGLFLIVKEESVQSGIRRVYGADRRDKALAYVNAARDWRWTAWASTTSAPCPTPRAGLARTRTRQAGA